MVNITEPITLSMPVRSDSRAELLAERRAAMCPPKGQKGKVEAVCRYASERNITITLVCDGTRTTIPYRCPALPRCTFWNGSAQGWGMRDCVSLPMTNPSSRMLSCHVKQLATFSAVADSVVMTSSILSLDAPEPVTPVRSYGLVVTGKASGHG